MRENVILGSTVYLNFTTRAFSTGIPTTLLGSPTLSVLEQDNATPITNQVSVEVDRAGVAGLNQATVVATAGNGFEVGKNYAVYISAGTVDSVSAVGEVVGQFFIEEAVTLPGQIAPPLAPTRSQMLSWLYKAFRNRKSQTSSTWSLFADDETTVDAKATVTDDGVTAVKQEIIAGP